MRHKAHIIFNYNFTYFIFHIWFSLNFSNNSLQSSIDLTTAIVGFVLFELIVIFYLAFKVAQKAKKIRKNQ